jgi:hypothetical protein
MDDAKLNVAIEIIDIQFLNNVKVYLHNIIFFDQKQDLSSCFWFRRI